MALADCDADAGPQQDDSVGPQQLSGVLDAAMLPYRARTISLIWLLSTPLLEVRLPWYQVQWFRMRQQDCKLACTRRLLGRSNSRSGRPVTHSSCRIRRSR